MGPGRHGFMDPERWKRIEELFARAETLPASQLEGFLAAECGHDPALRKEVGELLGFRGAAGSIQRIVGAELGKIGSGEEPAAELPERLVDRFVVKGKLGAGGMGVVYEVFDEQRGEVVALKALPVPEPQRIDGLKQEFRALASLSHPRLVRLHELFTDGVHWFFTMQKLDGVEYLAHVRPGFALDEAALRGVLRDLVDGIAAVHAAGKLHRDLKPSNVLIVGGRAMILDFGLARALDAAGSEIAGTPGYMAPEVFAGKACAESDWYALGVMLYEAITGERPLKPGAPPHGPADLVKLTAGLLAADPAARRAALAAAGLGTAERRASSDEAVFVGRRKELETLDAAYREVDATQGPVVVRVEGASGIGKSALLARYLDTLVGALVLRGRCYERENVPFKALDAIVDELARELQWAPPPAPEHAGDLCRIFPAFGRVFAGGAATSDARQARQRAIGALAQLLGRVAAARPLVIAIDDLQWGDTDSGILLDALLDARIPILWILAYRAGEPCALAEALAPRGGPHLVVGGLGAAEAAELVGAMGGERALIETIVAESGGNPFFIGELTRSTEVVAGGHVELAGLVQHRVARLEPEARRLLEVIALAGAPITIDAARAAAGLADDAAIPVLRAGSWVRTNTAVVESYHDRIRSAVAAALAPAERAALHGRLAGALEAARAAPELLALHFREAGERGRAGRYTIAAAEAASRTLAFERAAALYREALELAGPDAALERALGDALANAGRGPDAAEAYLRAARLSGEADALELERRAAHQYFSTGHIALGRQVGGDVMSRLGLWIPKSPWLAQLIGLVRFGRLLVRGPKPPRHAEDSPLALHRYDVTNELFQSTAAFEPMHGFYFAASAALRGAGLADPLRRADAIGNVAALMALVRGKSGGAAAKWLHAQRAIAESVGTPAALGVAATFDGVSATYVGDWTRASPHLAEAERLLSSCDGVVYRFQLATVQAIHSWVLFYRGDLAEQRRATLRRLDEALAKGNVLATNGQTTHVSIAVPLATDDIATAARWLDEAEARLPADAGYSQQHTWILLARCMHALYAGDPEAGYARLHAEIPKLKRSRLLGIQIAQLQFLWARATLAAATGHRREAELAAKRLLKNPVGGAQGFAWLARAMLARGTSDCPAMLARARDGFTACGMAGFAAACEWHLGGADRDRAEAYFRAEGIARPDRFVVMHSGYA